VSWVRCCVAPPRPAGGRPPPAPGAPPAPPPPPGGGAPPPRGEDWFLHFQQSGAHGRLVHLQPMRWGADGWPVLGADGAPVRVHRKPDLPEQAPSRPAVDDTFPGGRFGRQWQWTANPAEGWASQHTDDGLRLGCVRSDRLDDLRSVPHVLTQRLPAGALAVEVGLRLDSTAPGARAGLVVLGDAYAWTGLERAPDGTTRLVHRFAPAEADRERDAAHARPVAGDRVLLRIEVTPDARCRFSYTTDDTADGPVRLGPEFAATPWRWVGALLGLFAGAPEGAGHAGTAVFSAFRVTAG
ncbi:beta-xylosidase family glycoside hydrolase, partial [Streptomyces zaomyceticus]